MNIIKIIISLIISCVFNFELFGERQYPYTQQYFAQSGKVVEKKVIPSGRAVAGDGAFEVASQARFLRYEQRILEEEKQKIETERQKINQERSSFEQEKKDFNQKKVSAQQEKTRLESEKKEKGQEKVTSSTDITTKPGKEEKVSVDTPLKQQEQKVEQQPKPVVVSKEPKHRTALELFKQEIGGVKNITALISLVDSLSAFDNKKIAADTKAELSKYAIDVDGIVIPNIIQIIDVQQLHAEEIRIIKEAVTNYWNSLVKGSTPETIDRNQAKESDKAVRDVLMARLNYPSLLDKEYSKKWETMKKQGPFFSQELFINAGSIIVDDKKFENRLEGFIYYLQKILIDQLGKKAAFKKRDELRQLIGLSFNSSGSLFDVFEKIYVAAGKNSSEQRATFYNDMKGTKQLFGQFLAACKMILYNTALLQEGSSEFDAELYRSLKTAYINCILTVHGEPTMAQKSDRVLFGALKTFAISVLADESKADHMFQLYTLLDEIRLHPAFGHYASWMGSIARKKFFELLGQLDKIALNGPKLEPLLEYLADPHIDQLAAPKEVTFEDKLFEDNDYLQELIDQNRFGQKRLVDVIIDVIVQHRLLLKGSKTETKQEERLTGLVNVIATLFKSKTSTQKKTVSPAEMIEVVSQAVAQGARADIADILIAAINSADISIAKISALFKELAGLPSDAKDPEFITIVNRSVGSWLYQNELLAIVSQARTRFESSHAPLGTFIIRQINDLLVRSNMDENPLYKDLNSKKEALLRSTTWTPFQFYTTLLFFIPKDILNKEILGGLQMQKGDQTYDWRARKTFYQWIKPYGIVFAVVSKWNELVLDQEKDQLSASVYNLALLKNAFIALKTVGETSGLKPGMSASSKPLEGNALTKEISAKEHESIMAQNPLGMAKFGFSYAGGIFESLPLQDLKKAFDEYNVMAIIRIMRDLLSLSQEETKSISQQMDITMNVDGAILLAAGPPPPPPPPPPLPPKGKLPIKESKSTDGGAVRSRNVRPSEVAEQSLLQTTANALRYEMLLSLIQQLSHMKELVLTDNELPSLGSATIAQRNRSKDVYAYLAQHMQFLLDVLEGVVAKKPRDVLVQSATSSAAINKKIADLGLPELSQKLNVVIKDFASWLDSKKEVADEADRLYITDDLHAERDMIFATVEQFIQSLQLRLVNIAKGLPSASVKQPEQKAPPVKITPGVIPPPPPPPPGGLGKRGSPPPPPPPPPTGWKPRQ